MDNKNLTNKDLIGKLVLGSKAIDQMRKDIDSVISGVIGLLIKVEPRIFPDSYYGIYKSSMGEWEISVDKHRLSGIVKREISYHLSINQKWTKVYSTSSGLDAIHTDFKYVQRVHAGLPIFVDGMRKDFPILEQLWQPILDAADYAREDRWR